MTEKKDLITPTLLCLTDHCFKRPTILTYCDKRLFKIINKDLKNSACDLSSLVLSVNGWKETI